MEDNIIHENQTFLKVYMYYGNSVNVCFHWNEKNMAYQFHSLAMLTMTNIIWQKYF